LALLLLVFLKLEKVLDILKWILDKKADQYSNIMDIMIII